MSYNQYAETRHARAELTRQACDQLRRSEWDLDRVVRYALLAAERDWRSTPVNTDVIEAELHLWYRLRDALTEFRASDPSPRDRRQYAQRLRTYLTYQRAVLALDPTDAARARALQLAAERVL